MTALWTGNEVDGCEGCNNDHNDCTCQGQPIGKEFWDWIGKSKEDADKEFKEWLGE